MTTDGRTVHIVCVPFPAQGHITPMLNLAKLLHFRGFFITFVNTEYNHRRLLRSRGPNSLDGTPTFRFEAIPDGLPPSDADVTQDILSLFGAVLNNFLDPFMQLLLKLQDSSSSSPPVNIILSDAVLPFTQDAAKKLGGLPVFLFWTSSPCSYLCFEQFCILRDKGTPPIKDRSVITDGSFDMTVDLKPSMKGMRLKDFPASGSALISGEDDLGARLVLAFVESCRKYHVILNTFEALEADVLKDIANTVAGPLYAVGPLHSLVKHVVGDNDEICSLRSNLWKEDSSCLQWLDSRKPKSVVYVSFGSITTMTKEQLIEFAWGLANSKYPFLWIVRPDSIAGDLAIITPEFLNEVEGRAHIASWCNQEEVLEHPSIGAFLTHCGWNSTLETVSSGVPVLCWPFFGDQRTNCWYFCQKWGIGMEIDGDVKREVLEKQVREVMEGEMGREMNQKALELKKLAEEATSSPSGSSYSDFENLVNQFQALNH